MKLVTIQLDTNDLAGTRTFYTKRLGLPLLTESVDRLTFQVGWTRLTFRAVSNPVGPYHFAINVPGGMLEMCMHWFGMDYIDTQAHGQKIAEFADWRARAAYFPDNNGNLLEFITRHDVPSGDANLTISDLFQGISEIGIATPCVLKTISQLNRQFGIKPFRKAKPKHDFAALGDDYGLFILSQEHRHWLFTRTPASLNNCQITFELEPGGPVQTIHSQELIPAIATHRGCTCSKRDMQPAAFA
ncbi:VOC family protein [Spirosoma koreense]